MASKIVIFACVLLAVSDVITGQVIKNFGCGCGCGGADGIPNQIYLNQAGLLGLPGFLGGNVISGLGSNVLSPALYNGQYGLPATNTIIQDNSVATNLANTLQLLLVSNLLSNTLPNSPEVVVPACSPYGGLSYCC